ncbi:beta-1,2-xylosyltransferase XYXT1-like isoform X1 [Hordeum vulgare subsp. vulgare]|uniref:beta-1,2-xylosyltransferase XYXT1-like isoform X1 n=1 Tax=Hordeum vulgare subsp. vulgare TaxID=112509 RepID=UPI001D1A3FDB|nr:beta-1,2-xylosyltransferase XYXT1-like isoform X1 [Hordeum vulgare subsp. vulgare]
MAQGMAGDGSSSQASSGVVRSLARHHQAVLGFLLGFFVTVMLYTTVSGLFRSTNSIVVMQSRPGEHTEQSALTAAPLVSSTPNSSTQAVHDIENGQKHEVTKTMEKERIEEKNLVDGTDMNNKTGNVQVHSKLKEELIRQELDQDDDGNNGNNVTRGAARKPICDLSDPRYDICEISGDARAIGANRTVLYVPPPDERGPDGQEWAIRDQSRKDLGYIDKVNVKTLSTAESLGAPECTSRHTVPAVVFAMNGLTSNPWHDFSDVLIPLFITTRAYDGEIQFLITDLRSWFVDKYRLILTNLSRYDIVDFNKDANVRCYPHIIVGLRSHADLGIDPARTPQNYTMVDFRMYIRDVFSLPPEGQGIPYEEANKKKGNGGIDDSMEKQRPRLMLISRAENRKFVNLPEISAAVEAAGFEVLVMEPLRDMRLEEFSRVVDSCDVLMGAHGAALTSFFFLRTNAVVLQVVPWGLEREAMSYFGVHAKDMMLLDIEYTITVEESTLYEKYGKDHVAVSDLELLRKQGWQLLRQYLWEEQDIRLNVTRFSPTLHQLLRTLSEWRR